MFDLRSTCPSPRLSVVLLSLDIPQRAQRSWFDNCYALPRLPVLSERLPRKITFAEWSDAKPVWCTDLLRKTHSTGTCCAVMYAAVKWNKRHMLSDSQVTAAVSQYRIKRVLPVFTGRVHGPWTWLVGMDQRSRKRMQLLKKCKKTYTQFQRPLNHSGL